MKKLIVFTLILVMILPAAVHADSLAGCWVVWLSNAATFGSGNLFAVLVMNENNTMALMMSSGPGDQVATRQGTWHSTDKAVIISFPDTEEITLEYRDGMIWFPVGQMNVGMKRVEYTADQLEFGN